MVQVSASFVERAGLASGLGGQQQDFGVVRPEGKAGAESLPRLFGVVSDQGDSRLFQAAFAAAMAKQPMAGVTQADGENRQQREQTAMTPEKGRRTSHGCRSMLCS
jgi:hypothetical protein